MVWGGLMAVWGGLIAVWDGLMAVWGGLEVVWWWFGVFWVVWGISMDRVNEGNSISFIYTIGFYRCFGIHSVISLLFT